METKHALLDHAEAFVRSRGFDAFSYADLSGALGIRKASVHYHFPTKSDLALALITRYARRFVDDLARVAAVHAPAAAHLGAYLGLYRDALKGGDALCLCVALGAGRESMGADVLARLDEFHADSRVWLIAAFTRAQADGSVAHMSDPIAEAEALLALVQGAQLLARSAGWTDPYDAATAAFRARLAP
ncbi:MAG: TetR/AcrR family transcriptional regulator [Roseicyclus sp.]